MDPSVSMEIVPALVRSLASESVPSVGDVDALAGLERAALDGQCRRWPRRRLRHRRRGPGCSGTSECPCWCRRPGCRSQRRTNRHPVTAIVPPVELVNEAELRHRACPRDTFTVPGVVELCRRARRTAGPHACDSPAGAHVEGACVGEGVAVEIEVRRRLDPSVSMEIVPALVRSLASESVPSVGDVDALAGLERAALDGHAVVAEKEAAPPPARTRVLGDSGVPVLVPPAWV